MTHYMKLHAQPFEKIKSGEKKYELRLYDEKRQKIAVGDTIVFTENSSGQTLAVCVKALLKFSDFETLYKSLPLGLCGYRKEEIPFAKPSDMNKYYSYEQQKQYGVVAIEVETLK